MWQQWGILNQQDESREVETIMYKTYDTHRFKSMAIGDRVPVVLNVMGHLPEWNFRRRITQTTAPLNHSFYLNHSRLREKVLGNDIHLEKILARLVLRKDVRDIFNFILGLDLFLNLANSTIYVLLF